MTTMTPGPVDSQRVTRATSPIAKDAPTTDQIAPPPKMKRRPILVVGSVAVICLGALVSVWAYQSSSDARDVIAVRETIERGEVITAEDLISVRISVDPALRPLSTSEADSIIGQRAALDLPAGGVVTAEQITNAPIPADGMSVVGLNLSSAMLPAGQIRVGDQVRIVTTAGEAGTGPTEAVPATIEAEVVGISGDDISGNTILNVQVPHDEAPKVANYATAGRVAVVLDSAMEN